MSSGTQIELDWTGIDAAPGGAATPPTSGANGAEAGTGAYLTDEEILGLEPVGVGSKEQNHVVPQDDKAESVGARHAVPLQPMAQGVRPVSGGPQVQPATASGGLQVQPAPAMPEWMQAAAGDPKHGAEAQQLWQEHQAFRAAFSSPDEARAIKELFPGGAQEAQSLRQAAQAVDQLDAAIYSGDARAQSEVVAELARANPAAFRQLFAEAAKVLSRMDPTAHHGVIPSPGIAGINSARNLSERFDSVAEQSKRDSSVGPVTQALPRNDTREEPASQSPQFDPAAYAAFERSTNDAVARDVRAAVGDTLARVLPEGIAEGAARRIGDDIFNEIHRTLAADRSLSEQVGEVLRGSPREFTASGWRFGTAEQQRVASLLTGRAKQLVPGVARRVIGEWTSSVLGASRSKAARLAAAAGRVDIAAPGGSLDSMPLRPMPGRGIDYASMSDDEILGM